MAYANSNIDFSYHVVRDSHDLESAEGSSTLLVATPSSNSLPKTASFASISFIKDGSMFLRRTSNKCNGVLLEGPRRLMKLCLFGLLLPVLLISIPLYVRLILYPPFHFTMAPTDQRLLDQTSSSIWCQGQTVHMNGSFNAFLVPEKPSVRRQYSIHSMLQHMVLKDDMKEYWGFFLQKGSVVSLNLCTRYDGGMLMIMRGAHNLRKCAWIGEEDSAEQDEDHKEASNESGQRPELTHEFPLVPGEVLMEVESEKSFISRPGMRTKKANLTSEERKEELDFYLEKVLRLSKNKEEIYDGLKKQTMRLVKGDPVSASFYHKDEGIVDIDAKDSNEFQSQTESSTPNLERLERVKRFLEEESETGEVEVLKEEREKVQKHIYAKAENSSYELSNSTLELYMNLFKLPKGLKFERGRINQTNANDASNEEHRSSFSSSEEALTKCEGLIGLMPLHPSAKCHSFGDSGTNKIRYKIPVTGTYYFVFSSDNEVFDSDVFLNMTLRRVVFDTEAARETCVNKTDCSLAFSFWSHDQAIVEVPEGDWNAAYSLETKCQPRVAVYLFFLFLIPILILFCAFH